MILIIRAISFFIIIFLSSCQTIRPANFNDDSAKLTFFNSENKKTFSFVIGEEFIRKSSASKPSKLYQKMNVDELKLLTQFLKNNKYCVNKNDELSFKINSKQEKIYDVTFSSLIEQSYNAKPISPVTYFGECI